MDSAEFDSTVTTMIDSLCIDDAPSCVSENKPVPALPPKIEVLNVFNAYKDQLQKAPANTLPAEFIITDRKHYKLFMDLLGNHPRVADKVGVGVKYLFIRRYVSETKEEISCCFIKRLDDTEEEFSVYKAYRTINRKKKIRGKRKQFNVN